MARRSGIYQKFGLENFDHNPARVGKHVFSDAGDERRDTHFFSMYLR
jgi:hypothetical protein